MGVVFHVYLGVVLAGITLRAAELAYSGWFRRKWQKEMAIASREFNGKMEELFDKLDQPPVERMRVVGKSGVN